MPTPEALIKDLLSLILSDEDLDRAFVPFKADDDVVVFINNVGGMSVLEMGAALEVILSELGASQIFSSTLK
jgi:dihydroxyacetone kinase